MMPMHPCELPTSTDNYYNFTNFSINRCRPILFDSYAPLQWALPLYGYVMPVIVALTLATNLGIVTVLGQKHLRTPTNCVLLSMAVTELLTGLSSAPVFVWYYTLRGYVTTNLGSGLPAFWCITSPYLVSILPSMFHSAAMWLTVYLAVQRFIYICVPRLVYNYCSFRRTRQAIVIICVFSVWFHMPDVLATYQRSLLAHPNATWIGVVRVCVRESTSLLQWIGENRFYPTLLGIRTTLGHILPCILLVVFTIKLVRAISRADRRHAYLLSASTRSIRTNSINNRQKKLSTCVDDGNNNNNEYGRTRWSKHNNERRMGGLKQNTRMLILIIVLFLITEIPAVVIYTVHLCAVSFQVAWINYNTLNILLIIRNMLIIISYPFRFAIYCGMSTQFRQTVRRLIFNQQLITTNSTTIFDADSSNSTYRRQLTNNTSTNRCTTLTSGGATNGGRRSTLQFMIDDGHRLMPISKSNQSIISISQQTSS